MDETCSYLFVTANGEKVHAHAEVMSLSVWQRQSGAALRRQTRLDHSHFPKIMLRLPVKLFQIWRINAP
jgi:hypothetical protein